MRTPNFMNTRFWWTGPKPWLVGTTNNGYYLFLILGYIFKFKFLTEIFDPSYHPSICSWRERERESSQSHGSKAGKRQPNITIINIVIALIILMLKTQNTETSPHHIFPNLLVLQLNNKPQPTGLSLPFVLCFFRSKRNYSGALSLSLTWQDNYSGRLLLIIDKNENPTRKV